MNVSYDKAVYLGLSAEYLLAKDSVGGIWADVNSTSSLQLNSLIYRFHPAVLWKHTYPARDEIVSGQSFSLTRHDCVCLTPAQKSLVSGRSTSSRNALGST